MAMSCLRADAAPPGGGGGGVWNVSGARQQYAGSNSCMSLTDSLGVAVQAKSNEHTLLLGVD